MIPVNAELSENDIAEMELDGFFESPEDDFAGSTSNCSLSS